MKMIRISLHSLVLAVVDIAGIVGGAVVASKALGVNNQVWLQLPSAVILSLAFFGMWMFLLWCLGVRRLEFTEVKEWVLCLVASLLWAPLVFVPLHYFTQGYLTSMSNLVVLALYQFPVNSLALCCLWAAQRLAHSQSSRRTDCSRGPSAHGKERPAWRRRVSDA